MNKLDGRPLKTHEPGSQVIGLGFLGGSGFKGLVVVVVGAGVVVVGAGVVVNGALVVVVVVVALKWYMLEGLPLLMKLTSGLRKLKLVFGET